jgi:PAS domain S-box-containing protein
MLGRTIDQLFSAEVADLHAMIDERVLDGDVVETESHGTGRQADRIFHLVKFPVLDETGESDGVGGIITDVTELRAAETERSSSERQYRALFERSIDAILVADDTGRYVDANPAATELFGLSREALMARRSFEFIDEEWAHGPNMEADWQAFLRAGSHTGEVRLRRDDGGVRLVEYAAMANVALGRHTWVLRDVTARRRSEHLVAQRVRTIESLERMQPGLTPELTATAICAEITRHVDLPNAAIVAFEADGTGSALASAFAGDAGHRLPRRISDIRSARLRERAADGAWIETLTQATDPVLWADLASGGGDLVAFAPIRVGEDVMGLLMVGDGPSLTDQPALIESVEEFAALTSSVLGPPLSERRRVRDARARISRILADHTFHPVFQALVDLESGDVSGYEALTRFDDGTAPDRMFALAATSGLGLALERATIEAALDAASSLPSEIALNLNVSPALVLAGEQLHRLLDRTTCDIVLEITEHEPVEDYRALRKAVARFGDRIRLSVDDAGAGFASLRHILELRPAIVKLDRGLVEGVDGDPVRQALVAGMVHFASRAGTILIGEGIETEAERTTLLSLGVQAGQGFLFGRPAPLPESAASMAG